MSYRLGVDLGTTFTAAAVSNGMPATMVGLGNRALQIPSVLFLTPEGDFLVGESAERRGLAQPDRVVREFKRRIGDSVPMLVAGAPYSPQSLTARLLRHVCGTAQERMGEAPEQIVLTHPANWGPYKLELLDQVASLADIGPVVRCPEPLAAAAQYASQNRVEVGDTIAVYDLGGGTFDACVLRKTATGFSLLGTPEGIEHLGGIDFDEALFQHAIGMLGDRISHLDPEDLDTLVGLARLRRDCVDTKEALSTDTDALLPVSLPGISTTLRLNRTELEALVRPALTETVEALARTLRSADVTPDQVTAIVLVGGSSRIPLVGELLQRAFGRPTALDTHPKHDVALGAVQQGSFDDAASVSPSSAVSTLRAAPRAASRASSVVRTPVDPPSQRQDTPDRVDPLEQPAPSRPEVLPRQARRPRRRLMLACVAAGAVIAGVVAGVVWVSRDSVSGDGVPTVNGTSFDSGTPTDQTNQLPASAALTPTQLIVPVQIGANWDLWLADTNSPAPVLRLTSDPLPDTTPAISPDRKTVIYTHDLNLDGKRTLLVKATSTAGDGRPLFDPMPAECRGTIFRPAWNPVHTDELAIPCVDEAGKVGLYRITTQGDVLGAVQLPAGSGRVDDPAYSSDGKQLVFWAAPMSTWDGGTLYTVPVSGGTPKMLLKTSTRGEDADAVWAPDGKHIVFRRRVPDGTTGGNFDIFSVSTDGRATLERLTDDPADEQDPVFSPSGDQIAYKSAAQDPKRPVNDVSRIWVMDASGHNKHPLWSQGPDESQTAAGWGRR